MINELDDLNNRLKLIQTKIDETTKVLKECINNKVALTDIITLTSELQTLLSNFNLIVNKIKALQTRGRHIVKARLLGSLRSFPRNIINNDTNCMQWNETDDLVEILDQLKSSLRVLKTHKFDNYTFEQVFCEGHSLSKAIVKVIQGKATLSPEDQEHASEILAEIVGNVAEEIVDSVVYEEK